MMTDEKKITAAAIRLGIAMDVWIEHGGCDKPCMANPDRVSCTQFEVYRDDPRYCWMFWVWLTKAVMEVEPK